MSVDRCKFCHREAAVGPCQHCLGLLIIFSKELVEEIK